MPVSSPLTGTGRIAQRDFDNYLKQLGQEPKNVAQGELQKLLDAGEARLPEGASTVLRDALWALANDAWDPTKQSSFKRPAPPKVDTIEIQRERSMDGTSVNGHMLVNVTGKAEPGALIQIQNMSRNGQPQIHQATANADGTYSIRVPSQQLFWGEQLSVRVRGANSNAWSDAVTKLPKSVDVQVWRDRRENADVSNAQKQESPWFQAGLMENTHQRASKSDPQQHLVVAGKANSVPPNAKLEILVDTPSGQAPQSVNAMPDGSFLFDMKGVKPGTQVEMKIVDGGMISVQRFNVPPLKFDAQKLAQASQGVPYDRIANGKVKEDGPFMRFAADGVADPGTTVVVKNHTTGKSFEAVADANGRIDLEVGAHAGDALGFLLKDAAGNIAQTQLENFPVPATPNENMRLTQIVCGNALLKAQVDELITILGKEPTSVHRDILEKFVAAGGGGERKIADRADLERLKKAVADTFCGANDVKTNATNPEPKEPIVIGARVIKPRFMDAQPQGGRDPIEVEGKAEPFSTVEIRNASMQGSPVIGTAQADKDGNFKFIGRDESKFMHGDQLYVKATDQGGAASKSTIAKTCAYELQIWRQQPREVLVELPRGTDTRQPFIDAQKLTSARDPIAPNGKEQVFTITGAAGSVEPNAILRVVNKAGETYEATSNKDGSFKLPVGKFQPGEQLNVMVVDTNGLTAQQRINTTPLKFDQSLVSSTGGVPYQRFTAAGKADQNGPFLDFKGAGVVDPHSFVTIKNNSTGRTCEVQADANGGVNFSLSDVHTGDSLSFTVRDPAGNLAPNNLENFVVPGTPTLSKEMQELECQHTFVSADVDRLLTILKEAPTAVNRTAFETILAKGAEAFDVERDMAKLQAAVSAAFAKPNDVRSHAENPAPKRPIVLDADIIKPRFMDAQPQRGRDPLEVRGKAEPFATVEIRNASQPGFPVIGSATADKDGNYKFTSTNENLFLHGDQLVLRARDQGGAVSKDKVVTTCAYELRIWNNPPRTEKVKLDRTTDTRAPFIDMQKATHLRPKIAGDGKEQIYVVQGQAMAAEPNSIVRVTNKKGEPYETKVRADGSFDLKVGNHEPGEQLTLHVIDGNGQVTQQRVNTPALKFDPNAFLNSGDGAPYTKATPSAGQSTQGTPGASDDGPYLRFQQPEGALDPFSFVVIKNNSTGKEFRTQADANGKIDMEISGVHVGDSLSLRAEDPAKNVAPNALVNYIVPGTPRPTARLADLCHQQTLNSANAEELVKLLKEKPTAANRGLVEEWLQHGHTTFQAPADKTRIQKALVDAFSGTNDVRTDLSNPAPKEPIVLDARVIKPRVMDQGSVANRDPLEVFGTAEPFAWIEIRNASMPNAPSLGRVQADANGEWKLTNRDESKFLHGDQLLIRAVDQGNAASKEVVSRTCQYELQVWNQQNRTELVRLPETTDTRPPFIDTSKIKQGQTLATKQKPSTFTSFEGGPLSAEPRSVIRFEGPNGTVLGECKVNDDGSFKIDVSGYKPGETIKATAFDAAGQVTTQQFRTQALTFDPAKMLAEVDGPPYQKLTNGRPAEGGPFLAIKAPAGVAFPGAIVEITNHSTGKKEEFTADASGAVNFEMRGVHAFDLLTFKVKDAAGNEAPNVQRAWQVPAESRGVADPTVVALTSQRPVDEDVVKMLVDAVKAQPTAQHRMLCDNLLRQHPDWFMSGKELLEKELKEIFKGPPEIVPDSTNPAPKRPIVLGAEIIKPRVMDSGNPPRDPLVVNGLAEPLSTIEIYNGSVPGRPLIGTVQVGEDGKFAFQSNDESKFLHGDQIVVMAKDAGGKSSDATVSKAKAFELRIWNQTNRREKVALDGPNADTRDPFLQTNLIKTERAGGTQQSNDSFVLVGAPGSTEVFGTVSVTIGGNTYKAEAGLDGSFRLPVPGLTLGTPVELIAGDPNGRSIKGRVTPSV